MPELAEPTPPLTRHPSKEGIGKIPLLGGVARRAGVGCPLPAATARREYVHVHHTSGRRAGVRGRCRVSYDPPPSTCPARPPRPCLHAEPLSATTDGMPGTNTKLTTAVETYLTDLQRIRASGGATGERSYYGPLANLLNAVGNALKPKVICVGELADQGQAIPTSGCMQPSNYKKTSPRKVKFPNGVSLRSSPPVTTPG